MTDSRCTAVDDYRGAHALAPDPDLDAAPAANATVIHAVVKP